MLKSLLKTHEIQWIKLAVNLNEWVASMLFKVIRVSWPGFVKFWQFFVQKFAVAKSFSFTCDIFGFFELLSNATPINRDFKGLKLISGAVN